MRKDLIQLLEKKESKEKEEIKKGRITEDEKIVRGGNGFKMFGRWIKSFSVPIYMVYLLLVAFFQFGIIFLQWFLGSLSEDQYKGVNYEKVIIWTVVCTYLISMLATCVYSIGSYKSGRLLYQNLVKSILRRPMKFFDATPIGAVLARLINDKDSIDTEVGYFQ